MGKGDKKTRRGKIWIGTFGVRRARTKQNIAPAYVNPRVTSAVKKPEQPKIRHEVKETPEIINETLEINTKTTVADTKEKVAEIKKETGKTPAVKKAVADAEPAKTTKKASAKQESTEKKTKPKSATGEEKKAKK